MPREFVVSPLVLGAGTPEVGAKCLILDGRLCVTLGSGSGEGVSFYKCASISPIPSKITISSSGGDDYFVSEWCGEYDVTPATSSFTELTARIYQKAGTNKRLLAYAEGMDEDPEEMHPPVEWSLIAPTAAQMASKGETYLYWLLTTKEDSEMTYGFAMHGYYNWLITFSSNWSLPDTASPGAGQPEVGTTAGVCTFAKTSSGGTWSGYLWDRTTNTFAAEATPDLPAPSGATLVVGKIYTEDGTTTFVNTGDTTATAGDVKSTVEFYLADGTKTSGSMASISLENPSISCDSSGEITASYSVSPGFVESLTVKQATLQLPVRAAQTITPTTVNQTISSGVFLTGTQTILGDLNLVASNIKEGVTIFGVLGTFSGEGGSGVKVTDWQIISSNISAKGAKSGSPSKGLVNIIPFSGLIKPVDKETNWDIV